MKGTAEEEIFELAHGGAGAWSGGAGDATPTTPRSIEEVRGLPSKDSYTQTFLSGMTVYKNNTFT